MNEDDHNENSLRYRFNMFEILRGSITYIYIYGIFSYMYRHLSILVCVCVLYLR